MKEIEYLLPESIEDLKDNHFIVYNPDHKKSNDWHYEYQNLQDALCDGVTINEIESMIKNDYIRICLEVSEVEE